MGELCYTKKEMQVATQWLELELVGEREFCL